MRTKSDEIRVRRLLERRGLKLGRCRRRDPTAEGFGLYRVTDGLGKPLTGQGYRLTLDEAETWAGGARPRRRPQPLAALAPELPCVELQTGDALTVLRSL